MAENRSGGSDREALDILRRYSAGDISARRAAVLLGSGATEHDVYVATQRAGLHLPLPPQQVIDAEVRRAQELLSRLARRT